jgi:hypothetical protein
VAKVLVYLGAFVAAVWALLDIAQTPSEQTRGRSRGLWALVALVPFAGAAAWLLLGHAPAPTPARRAARGPIGPDDDPDFMRDIGHRPDAEG